MYEYNGTVVKIVDADTIDVRVDIGFGISYKERFMVLGFDAWEMRGEERPRGIVAKNRVLELIPIGDPVIIKTHKDKKGKYGRYLAEVFTHDGENIGELLIKEGHAKKY